MVHPTFSLASSPDMQTYYLIPLSLFLKCISGTWGFQLWFKAHHSKGIRHEGGKSRQRVCPGITPLYKGKHIQQQPKAKVSVRILSLGSELPACHVVGLGKTFNIS